MAHILPEPPRTWAYPMASPPPQCPHGTAYAQPCYSCGWTCPACKRSYAPWVRECSYRHEDDQPAGEGMFSGYPLTIPPGAPGTPPNAVLQFRVPPEWNSPHYQRKFAASSAWQEVWPGLQCRSDGPPASSAVYVSFRLTPEGAEGDPLA